MARMARSDLFDFNPTISCYRADGFGIVEGVLFSNRRQTKTHNAVVRVGLQVGNGKSNLSYRLELAQKRESVLSTCCPPSAITFSSSKRCSLSRALHQTVAGLVTLTRTWMERGVIEVKYVSSPPSTLPYLPFKSIFSNSKLALVVDVLSSINLSLSATG